MSGWTGVLPMLAQPSRVASLPLLLALYLLLPGAASPADGVLEINQTCAVDTGCFTGDAAGFPVTIGQPGSYQLTSNLVNTTSLERHIEIVASYVTLDLAGFEVSGPVTCIGTPPGCSGGPNGRGIAVDTTNRQHVVVRNGTVRGIDANGITLGERATVEDVHVDDVAGDGIDVGDFSTVQRSTVVSATNNGIRLGDVSRAVDNVVMSTANRGITCSEGCVLTGNAASGATNFAIEVIRGGVVTRNSATNSQVGIRVSTGAVVRDNAVVGNATGIEANIGSLVWGNVLRSNTSQALSCATVIAQPTTRYGRNVLTSNNGTNDLADGDQGVSSDCLQFTTNHCGTDTICP